MNTTKGIHHITAITGDPQKNLDFYEGFLGQRLVKKTVNFDDPRAYHLYYGDAVGSPGTIMTFFYWNGIPKGTRGSGEVSSIFYSINPSSISFWKERAEKFNIKYTEKTLPFGENVIMLNDPDGLEIGLVVTETDTNIVPWLEGTVPEEHVLGGFYGALLTVSDDYPIDSTLKQGLGYTENETKDEMTKYQSAEHPGKFLATQNNSDVVQATQGAGSVHHIAFQARDDEDREKLRSQVNETGLSSTGLIDRQYFHSTYFMTPAKILFEIATNDIGFSVDENITELGEHLKLPEQYEARREEIVASLTKLNLPRNKQSL